jgi:hypothetical protein
MLDLANHAPLQRPADTVRHLQGCPHLVTPLRERCRGRNGAAAADSAVVAGTVIWLGEPVISDILLQPGADEASRQIADTANPMAV